MQGPEELLVDFASATIGSNNYHPIDRDHSDMVKFSSVEDSNYRAALVQIRQLSSDAGFQQESTTSQFLFVRDNANVITGRLYSIITDKGLG